MIGLVLGTIGKEIGSSFARNFAMASVKEGAKNVVKSTGFKVGAGVVGAGAAGFGTYEGIKHFKNKKKAAAEETDQMIESKQEEVKPATEINAVVVPEEDQANFEKLNAKIDQLEKENAAYKQSIDTLNNKFDQIIAQLTPSEEPKAEQTVAPQPQMMQQPMQPQNYNPNPAFQMGLVPGQAAPVQQSFNSQPVENIPAVQAETKSEQEPVADTTEEDVVITAADIAQGKKAKKEKGKSNRNKVNIPNK